MIKLIKALFSSNPAKKIEKAKARKYKQAIHLQRNGKLREFAEVMKEIAELEEKHVEVMSESE